MRQFNTYFALARSCAIAGGAAESVTWTVMLKLPGPLGVPLMTPVLASVSPVGNCPEVIPQVYGGVPPWAARVAEYATPATAPGREAVATDKGISTDDCSADCVDWALLEPTEQPQQAANSTRGKIICFTLHLGLHEPGGAKQAIDLSKPRIGAGCEARD